MSADIVLYIYTVMLFVFHRGNMWSYVVLHLSVTEVIFSTLSSVCLSSTTQSPE